MTYDIERGPGWTSRVLTIRFRGWTFSVALDRNR